MMSLCYFVLISVCIALINSETPGYGPEKVKQYSGYITIDGFRNDQGTHLYYWFFEARNNPSTAPLMLWLTGGPGCSSLTALFFENGPYIINDDLTLKLNPYSWNEVANVIWVDQPVGTGFSYADHFDDYVTDEDQVAEDLYQFMEGFFKLHPEYANLPFYVVGESYAGHYVPAVSARIVKGNQDGGKLINLKGSAIGNGWVDPYSQYGSYGELLRMKGLLDTATVVAYNASVVACKLLIDSGAWPAAFYECSLAMEGALLAAEAENFRTINVYDVRIPCEVEPLCYNFSNGDALLNLDSVKKALGVDTSMEWEACNMIVHTEMLGDWIGSFAFDVPILLKANVSVLVYSGTEDFVCNYLGGQNWVSEMEWDSQQQFNNLPLKPWTVNGKQAGLGKSYGGLSFLEVFDAGHMVPMDQPANALDMIKRFVNGQPF